MCFSKVFKKAMIDNDIQGNKMLSEVSGLSYGKVTRLLNGDGSSRLIDGVKLADTLGLKLKFIKE